MPIFMTNRDFNFIKHINYEMVDRIIETSVYLFGVDPNVDTNIYGEATEKIFKPGISVNCLLLHEDHETDTDHGGPSITQHITMSFFRNIMEDYNFYPENGDYIKWNNGYYEINSVVDNQLIAGRVEYPLSIICTATLTNRSTITIRNLE